MKKKFEYKHLKTPQGEALSGMPWNVYPRPQMKRDSFLCLNGEWDFSAEGVLENAKIVVPFAPESLLSGIRKDMGKAPKLRYARSFSLPEGFRRDRVLLHFGAVDETSWVWLNGIYLGCHDIGPAGWNTPFDVDCTKEIKWGEKNVLVVRVYDSADAGGIWKPIELNVLK